MEKRNIRKSNFELLRIISMLMIVSYHYAVHGIQMILDNTSAYTLYAQGSTGHKLFTSFLTPGGAVGVALFFMISGFFCVNRSNVTLHKIVLESFYYGAFSIILAIIFEMIGGGTAYSSLSIVRESLSSLFTPITNGNWWFITAYVFLMLMSPVISKFVNKLNRTGLVFLLFISWILWYCFPLAFQYPYQNLQKAIFFFVVGACFQKLGIKQSKQGFLIVIAILVWSLYSVCSFYGVNHYQSSKLIFRGCEIIETCLFAPICAVCLFLVFKNIEIGTNNKINCFARTTLGIYLIHDSFSGRDFIWNYVVNPLKKQYFSSMYPLYAIATIISVFFLSAAIDAIRILYFEPKYMKAFEKVKRYFKEKYYVSGSDK